MTKAILNCSNKGGTGKTTLSTAIAKELDETTVVDADVDSSNFASIFGVDEKAEVTAEHEIKPVKTNGIKIYSVETFFEDSTVSLKKGEERKLIERLIHHAVKDEPEYLVVDSPPGSSSSFRGIVHSLSKRNIERGVVAISQPTTLTDLQRLVIVCNHLKLPVIGFIENMSGVDGYDIAPFGQGGVKKAVNNMNGHYFGEIPLSPFPDGKDEMVKPVAEEVVDYITSGDAPFMDKEMHAEPSWWDKVKSGLNIGIKSISNDLPVKELKEEYGFKGANLTLQMEITDIDRNINLGVRDGRIRVVRNPKVLAGGIKIPLKELKDAMRFKREVLYSPTAEEMEMDYSITEAVKLGFAEVWTNDELDIGEEVSAWDMLTLLEYLIREHIGMERIKDYLADEEGMEQI